MKRSYSVSEMVPDETIKVPDAMAELQATIEFSVELNRFYNVDLFQRGYYQVRTILKTPPKSPARIEISDNKVNAKREVLSTSNQAFTQSSIGESQKFQIVYRNEEVDLSEIFMYRIHTLVESAKLEKNLENMDFRLDIELWCNDDDEIPEGKMECVSSRTLLLHLSPTKGLHHAVLVLFDYFHLSAVDVVIHGTVIAIHQPYLTMPKPQKGTRLADHSTLEAVYFGSKTIPPVVNTSVVDSGTNSMRLQQAHVMHKTICKILLSAHESLQENLQLYATKIPGNSFSFVRKDCHTRLGEVVMKVQGVMEEDDLIQTAITDITQLCAENVILWAQFLEIALRQPKIHFYLTREHHNTRVRRFAEGFFTMDHTKSSCLSCYDPSIHGHSSLATLVRTSPYFNNLPSLPVECVELDGDATTLPVIFEDVYQNTRAQMTAVKGTFHYISEDITSYTPAIGPLRQRSASNSSSSLSQSNDSTTSPHMRKRSGKKKFIKNMRPDTFKRPSSYYCSDVESTSGNFPSELAGVTLIGYKKVPVPETSPAVLLGTLSPDSPDRVRGENLAGQLSKATSSSSLSAILPSACMHRGSQESIPESLTNSLRQSINGWPSMGKTADKTDELESNLNLSKTRNLSLNKARSENHRLVKSYSQGSQYVTAKEMNSPAAVDKISSSEFSDLQMNSSKLVQNYASLDITMKKEDYGKSATSGEKEESSSTTTSKIISTINSVDDDVSDDDDTHVANGFHENDVIDMYKKDFSNSISAAKKDPMDIFPSHVDNITIDIPPTFEPKKTDSALGSEILSQAEMNQSFPHTNASTPSEEKETNKGAQEFSKNATEISGYGCDNLGEKVTVIELLKEELSTTEVPEIGKNAFSHRAASDFDILKNCEGSLVKQTDNQQKQTTENNKEAVEKRRPMLSSSSSYPELSHATKTDAPRLVSVIGNSTVNECPSLASTMPYFQVPSNIDEFGIGLHLVVCVHGLDGNGADLRLVRTYLEMSLPGFRLEFLMAIRNQQDTFGDFEKMTDKLVDEILCYLDTFSFHVSRISFVGHSLGNIIIRSSLARPKLAHLLPKLYTFLSLAGPHLGTLYNTSGLVNMGMWFLQKWKKSDSLLQLALKDHSDPRQTFLYQLSKKPVLQHFKHVLLVGSHQDRYVPYHSSRIEVCKSAQKDTSVIGAAYREMAQNILEPVIKSPHTTIVRYDVFHSLPSTANTMIGRAAHIAVLDSEIFIEKFLTVTGLRYFQ